MQFGLRPSQPGKQLMNSSSMVALSELLHSPQGVEGQLGIWVPFCLGSVGFSVIILPSFGEVVL